MSEELEMVIEDAEASMKKAIGFLEAELGKIRAGKANPTMLDGITVEYYGAPTPISQVAMNADFFQHRVIVNLSDRLKEAVVARRELLAARRNRLLDARPGCRGVHP